MKRGCILILSLFWGIVINAQHSYLKGEEDSLLYAYSVDLLNRGQYDSALIVGERTKNLANTNNDSLLLAKSLNSIGTAYLGKGDLFEGFFYCEQSLVILRSIGDDEFFATALLNLGIAYKKQANMDKALQCLFEAMVHFDKKRNLKGLASAYNTIGNIYKEEKKYSKALEYLFSSLKLREDIHYEKGIAASLINIGDAYKTMGNYDSSLIYYNRVLKLKEIGSRPDQKANALAHIGETFYLKKNYALSDKFYEEAHVIFDSTGNKVALAGSYFDRAQLNYARGQSTLAEKQAFISITLAEETRSEGIILNCYNLLRKLYADKKDLPKTLQYTELYILLNEKIHGENSQKSLIQLEVKYEVEKKRRALLELAEEKRKAEALFLLELDVKNTRNRNLIITIALLVLVLVLVLLLVYNRIRFAKKLDLVIRELHHRVKNNFQVLLSLFSLQRASVKDESTREMIDSNRNRLSAMMLIHSGLYFDTDASKVKIANYIKSLVDNLLVIYGIPSGRIRIVYEVDESLDIDVDKSISLGLLINELITNALKYAINDKNTNPFLLIRLHKTQGKYHLLIQDNGPGMGSATEKRSFGLKLAETQAKQLKGTLQVREENGLVYVLSFE